MSIRRRSRTLRAVSPPVSTRSIGYSSWENPASTAAIRSARAETRWTDSAGTTGPLTETTTFPRSSAFRIGSGSTECASSSALFTSIWCAPESRSNATWSPADASAVPTTTKVNRESRRDGHATGDCTVRRRATAVASAEVPTNREPRTSCAAATISCRSLSVSTSQIATDPASEIDARTWFNRPERMSSSDTPEVIADGPSASAIDRGAGFDSARHRSVECNATPSTNTTPSCTVRPCLGSPAATMTGDPSRESSPTSAAMLPLSRESIFLTISEPSDDCRTDLTSREALAGSDRRECRSKTVTPDPSGAPGPSRSDMPELRSRNPAADSAAPERSSAMITSGFIEFLDPLSV